MIERLSVPERQELLDWIVAESVEVAPGIFRTPGVCGGEACIRDTRHTIWGLVESQRLGLSDLEILDRHPTLAGANETIRRTDH